MIFEAGYIQFSAIDFQTLDDCELINALAMIEIRQEVTIHIEIERFTGDCYSYDKAFATFEWKFTVFLLIDFVESVEENIDNMISYQIRNS